MGKAPRRVTCCICGKEFDISYNTYLERSRKHGADVKFYCPEHKNIGRSEDLQKALANLPEDERERRKKASSERAYKQWQNQDRKKIHETFSNAQKKRIDSMSPEERQKYSEELSRRAKEQAMNRTEEQREDFSRKMSARSKAMWENMSDEQRDAVRSKQSESAKRYIASLSPEEREKRNRRVIEAYANLSDEKKEELRALQSEHAKQRYENMSEEEKAAKMDAIHEGFRNYFADEANVKRFSEKQKEVHRNRPLESKESYKRKMKEWRDSLTYEEWVRLNCKRFASIGKNVGNNTLTKKFMNLFEEYGLPDRFTVINEHLLTNGGTAHPWDHAILDKNGKLVMIVDLDGRYFHSDGYDYDGMHSHLKLDQYRSLSVPERVPICIIQEHDFENGFKRMVELLALPTYDDYVEKMFKEYRAMPFPYPEFRDHELMSSYDRLVSTLFKGKFHDINRNTRLGDMLCLQFHQSIWDKVVDEMSPMQAWLDDEVLKQLIYDHILYHSYLNKNKILQGFDIVPYCQREQFLSAGQYKIILDKYLHGGTEIIDPLSRYSSRMLACVAMGKQYRGVATEEMANESNRMISLLRKYGIDIDATISTDKQIGKYDCMLTEVNGEDEISEFLKMYDCNQYIFITCESGKYKDNVKETILIPYYSKVVVI